MTYELFIADRTYSSWSLRAWLMFEKTGLPVTLRHVGLYSGTKDRDLAPVAPARTVPAIRTPEGWPLAESLAIAEELHERHPDAGLWPRAPEARVFARWVAAEMHAGYMALRAACPHQMLHRYEGFRASDAVRADVARIEEMWHLARSRFGGDGPWLFGAWSAADAFHAPICGRIAGYGLPVGAEAQAYIDLTLSDPAYRRWRAQALTETFAEDPYPIDCPTSPWPGPATRPARAVAEGTAENALCPYSGRPVADLLEIDGRIFGFCNPVCRDKTVNDPEAFPKFMALLDRAAP